LEDFSVSGQYFSLSQRSKHLVIQKFAQNRLQGLIRMTVSNPFQIRKHFKGILYRSNSANYREPIAGLRAISYLWIATFHAVFFCDFILADLSFVTQFTNYNPLGILFRAGHQGLEIFSLIGGFLLADSLFKQIESTGSFGVKDTLIGRLFRFWPILFIITAIQTPGHPKVCPEPMEFLFVMNYFHNRTPGCVPGSWSLSYDYQCWILVTFLFYFLHKRKSETPNRKPFNLSILAGIFIFSVAFRTFLVFMMDPYIGSDIHVRHVATPFFTEVVTEELNKTLPYNYLDPNILEVTDKLHTAIYQFYFPTHARFGSFILGVIMSFVLNYEPNIVKHLHTFNIPYSIASVVAIVLPILYSPLYCTNWAGNLSPFLKNLALSFYIYSLAIGVGYFTLLSLTSKEKFSCQISKFVAWFLSLWIWHPIAQLSFIGYLFNVIVTVILEIQIGPISPEIGTYYIISKLAQNMVITSCISVIFHLLVEMPSTEIKNKIYPGRMIDKEKKTL